MNIKYCISCGKTVEVTASKYPYYSSIHMKFIPATWNDPAEFDWCEGPFATSEPSDINEQEWDAIFLDEPDNDELEQMDENAENILGY